jgi:hypothetical protein
MAMAESANAVRAPTAARQTSAAIKPYSIAVAPVSSRKNEINEIVTAGHSPILRFDDQSTPAFNELLKPAQTFLSRMRAPSEAFASPVAALAQITMESRMALSHPE